MQASDDSLPTNELSAGPLAKPVELPETAESSLHFARMCTSAQSSTTELSTTEPLVAELSLAEQGEPQVVAISQPLEVAAGKPQPVMRSLDSSPHQLAYSTLLSLMIVLLVIVAVRVTVPPLVESLRYSWHHGQLRAEYDVSGRQLQHVSLSSLSEASELVSRRVGPSVVHINLLEVHENSTQRWFGGPGESVEMMGQGSGIVLDKSGHILTNYHVIDGAGRIEVSLSDGRRLTAHELGRDPFTDLAVIKVDAGGLMPVEWGDSNRVDVGSPVWAVGSPFGLERTVTFGILSGKHRIDLKGTRRWDNRDERETMYSDLMQSDVAVNPGNSGGPLVNSGGQIIGINTAIVGETYIGISFAIPSNIARRVADGLIKEGEVARGWLGLAFKNGEVDESGALIQRGALVGSWASSESPAKKAGIRPGDLIVKFGDKSVDNFRMLTAMVAQADVGSIVPLEVMREGKTLTLEVEIGRRPALQGDPR